jgi:HK97 family phage major capsid protein
MTDLTEAARLVREAREIRDRYPNGGMPADQAAAVDRLTKAATSIVQQAQADRDLDAAEAYLREPQYKHDMTGHTLGAGVPAGGFDAKGAGYYVPGGGGGYGDGSPELSTKTRAFLTFVRGGMGAVPAEHKADLVENATGLNLIPNDYAGTILKALPREGVLRDLCYVRPTTKAAVDIGNVVINTAGWGRLETGTALTDGLAATPAGKDQILVQDLNALVKLGRDELEDSDENLAEVIRAALALKFAELEDDAFAFGSGTAQPFGVARSTINPITQSVTAAANATVVAGDLTKVYMALPSRFQRNAHWIMHTSVLQAVMLLADTTGRPLLNLDGLVAGAAPTLLGRPWHVVDGLPSMATTGTATDPSLVFGDFKAGYMIADRKRVTVQRLEERYADEGKVGLLFCHRVGGDVIRPGAFVKYLL